MNWRRWIGVLGSLIVGLAWHGAAGGAEGRVPNIVLIVADDLGYGDLGCYGGSTPTPHIDGLAKSGIRFTDAYVTSPMCSPSRAGLLTGRYPQRFGHEFNMDLLPELGLPKGEKLLSQRLTAAGYSCGLVGKWHLGGGPGFKPHERGFGYWMGSYSGSIRADRSKPVRLNQNEGFTTVDDDLTQVFTREGLEFIQREKERPFFLYLSYTAVHSPLHAPNRLLNRFKHLSGRQRKYAAMLATMDEGVGRIVKKLRDLELDRQTLVVFVSDNGGNIDVGRNAPFSGGKYDLREGGIRVPMMMSWPGVIAEGKTYTQPAFAADIAATALAAAGVRAEGLDGVDLMPYLRGERSDGPHERLFWRCAPAGAVREGKWKLFLRERKPTALFDLEADPGETKDRLELEKEVVGRLAEAYAKWDATLVKPLWVEEREVDVPE